MIRNFIKMSDAKIHLPLNGKFDELTINLVPKSSGINGASIVSYHQMNATNAATTKSQTQIHRSPPALVDNLKNGIVMG